MKSNPDEIESRRTNLLKINESIQCGVTLLDEMAAERSKLDERVNALEGALVTAYLRRNQVDQMIGELANTITSTADLVTSSRTDGRAIGRERRDESALA